MKAIIFLLCLFVTSAAFAQWSGTTNLYTTGRVAIGMGSVGSTYNLQVAGPTTTINSIAIGQAGADTGGASRLAFFAGSGTYANGYFVDYRRNSTNDRLIFTDGGGVKNLSLYNGGNALVGRVNNYFFLGIDSATMTSGYGSYLYFQGAAANGDPLYMSRFNNGYNNSELRVNIGDDYGQAEDKFVVGTNYWSDGLWHAHLTVQANGNVGVGTTTPDAKLAVKGTVHAQEVKVDVSVPGPDYVFEKEYNLPSLEQVKSFIEKNHHLPEVPSAKEMESNGVNVGEMNMLLLKKVEELTLYVIELKAEMEAMKKQK